MQGGRLGRQVWGGGCVFPSKFQPCQGQQEAGASRDTWSGEVFAATRRVCAERGASTAGQDAWCL